MAMLLVVLIACPNCCLCSQVHADFEYIGQAANLTTLCVYGGTPYNTQEMVLRRVSVFMTDQHSHDCAG